MKPKKWVDPLLVGPGRVWARDHRICSYKTGESSSAYPTNQKRMDPSDPPLAKRDSWTGCHARAKGRNTCLQYAQAHIHTGTHTQAHIHTGTHTHRHTYTQAHYTHITNLWLQSIIPSLSCLQRAIASSKKALRFFMGVNICTCT